MIKTFERLPDFVKILFVTIILHLIISKLSLINIDCIDILSDDILELIYDVEIAIFTSIFIYMLIDSRYEIEKQKIISYSIHEISIQYYDYIIGVGLKGKLFEKLRNNIKMNEVEFNIEDFKGNILFDVYHKDEVYYIKLNEDNYQKLITKLNEFNYIITSVDYETFLIIKDFRNSIENIKSTIENYNFYMEHKQYKGLSNDYQNDSIYLQRRPIYESILDSINNYIRLVHRNEYSRKLIQEIEIEN